ncbi:MAG: acyltransferase family protein [Myxococcales bacterium FL481]|nr:MAG: acyltransferase family protein [Myxococcales bacterium FL481]
MSALSYERVVALLPECERARVESYCRDRTKAEPDVYSGEVEPLVLAYAIGFWLHRHYFRVRSSGVENLPGHGAAVIVANHSGVLPFDAAMLGVDIFRHSEPSRVLHYMVDHFAYRWPYLGTLFRALGQLAGTRRNFDGLVESGHLIGVFPEGAKALGKPASQRYELFPFSPGHVELAARHRVPVVPVGIVGAEEQQTMLTNLRPLARALRLPYFPITTTFPWFGPLGLLPKPVRYYLSYGEPLAIDPATTRSMRVRTEQVARVRRAVQDLVTTGLARRRSPAAAPEAP